jgi:hypothetical protein
MHTAARTWTIALLAALVISGCQDGTTPPDTDAGSNTASGKPGKIPPAGLVSTARPLIPDLPVPIGFKLAENISRNYESAGARFIDHTYIGRADKVRAERFYRLHMPSSGWTLRGSQMVRGTFLMRFEKASEFCEVRIWDEGSITGTRTHISMNVQTLGRGEAAPYRSQSR